MPMGAPGTPGRSRSHDIFKEEPMRILAVIFGSVLILLVALDAFETIVLPRRVTRRIRLSRLFYRTILLLWKSLGHLVQAGERKDTFLGYMGPLSLLALLVFWAVLFVFGFALLLWELALPLNAPDKVISFTTYLYLSGTTFFTLGLGDITPLPGVARLLVVSEVALGFIFLALVISYVPVIYQAFSRRELRISLLDSRAGSPQKKLSYGFNPPECEQIPVMILLVIRHKICYHTRVK